MSGLQKLSMFFVWIGLVQPKFTPSWEKKRNCIFLGKQCVCLKVITVIWHFKSWQTILKTNTNSGPFSQTWTLGTQLCSYLTRQDAKDSMSRNRRCLGLVKAKKPLVVIHGFSKWMHIYTHAALKCCPLSLVFSCLFISIGLLFMYLLVL